MKDSWYSYWYQLAQSVSISLTLSHTCSVVQYKLLLTTVLIDSNLRVMIGIFRGFTLAFLLALEYHAYGNTWRLSPVLEYYHMQSAQTVALRL